MALKKVKKQLEQTAETISDTAIKVGNKAASGAKEGAKAISEIAQDSQYRLLMSHYRPIFPEDYISPDFDLPKMIIIADEDEREDVEICEGAIGWLSKEAGLRVLHLYEEAISLSGLHFCPIPTCDSAYYVDTFDSHRYINLGSYFDVIQKDKMTELINIAHSLGAKKCELKTYELDKTVSLKKRDVDVKAFSKGNCNASSSANSDRSNIESTERKVLFSQTFEGDATPETPELHWYAHDAEIKRLIDSRCSKDSRNITKNYHVEIDSSASSTMSLTMATKIDSALGKLGASCNFSIRGEVQNESRRKLLFDIEF